MAFRGFQRSVGAAFPVAGDHILLRYNSYGRRLPQQHHHYLYQHRLWAVGTYPPPPPQWGGGGPALPMAGENSRTQQQLLPYYNYHTAPPQNYYDVYQDLSNHRPPQQFDYVQEDETLIFNASPVHPRQQQQQHARRNNNAGGGASGAGLSESQITKCLNIKIINNYIDNRAATTGEEEESEVCAICLDDLYCPDQSNNTNHHRNNINNNVSVGILGCKHIYHSGCIRNWLRIKNFCPMCKAVAYSP